MDLANTGKQALFEAIGYAPHDGQTTAHNLIDAYRFVTVVCGRRFGKTKLSIAEAAFQALQPNDVSGPPTVYVVSDTYDHAGKLFNPLSQLFTRELRPFVGKRGKESLAIYKKDRIIELRTGATIQAKSADNAYSLAGDGLTFAVIDESGFVGDYAIEVLLPALIDRKGKMLSVGTPDRSDTWFKRYFDLGLAEDMTDYTSLQMPSYANPLVDKEELVKWKVTMSDDDYRQYLLAEFVEAAENPFAQLLRQATIYGTGVEPIEGHKYVAGVDLADRTDYTVVVVVDITEKPFKVVKVARWRGIGYPATGQRIASILKDYNRARAWVDRTGVGDAAIPFITQHYGNIEPVVFSQTEKQNMFDTITTALEKGDLHLLDSNQLIEELRVLKAIQTKKGMSYKAPPGQHDDTVMSLFLAGKGFSHSFRIPKGANLGGFRSPI